MTASKHKNKLLQRETRLEERSWNATEKSMPFRNGSPGRIRTGDLSINSRMLYR